MKYTSKYNVILLFVFSLLIFTGISFLLRTFMGHFDETDHIAAGYLMSQGKTLYTSLFSHHFPFPYYWTYLFTFFWSETSPARTIGVFRLSITILYLIVFIVSYVISTNKKTQIWLSIWILFLSVFYTIYQGNLILSDSFSAVFIIGITWILLPILVKWEEYSLVKGVTSIVLAAGAFWTQPLLIMLFTIPLLLKQSMKDRLWIVISIGILILVPLVLFWMNGQLFDFIEQAIWFNFKVYPKYYFDYRVYGSELPALLLSPMLFLKNELFLFTSFKNLLQLFQFIAHLAVYYFMFRLIRLKKYMYLVTLIVLLFATRSREIKILPGEPFNLGFYPFMIVASIIALLLLDNIIKTKKITGILVGIVFFVIATIPLKPIFLQSLDKQYNYHVFWSYRQEKGQLIKSLSLKNEPVLIYPHDVDFYYFANRLPPDKFLYWFPWIDSVEKYRSERLYALKHNPPSVIYVGNLKVDDDVTFYGRYFPNLTKNYIQVKKENKLTGVWLRKDLQDRLSSM